MTERPWGAAKPGQTFEPIMARIVLYVSNPGDTPTRVVGRLGPDAIIVARIGEKEQSSLKCYRGRYS